MEKSRGGLDEEGRMKRGRTMSHAVEVEIELFSGRMPVFFMPCPYPGGSLCDGYSCHVVGVNGVEATTSLLNYFTYRGL